MTEARHREFPAVFREITEEERARAVDSSAFPVGTSTAKAKPRRRFEFVGATEDGVMSP